MKNITVSVDDEIYRAARVRAAEQDTTVSALVREFLTSLTAEKDKLAERRAALQKLFDKVDRREKINAPIGPLNRDEMYDERFR